MQSSEHGLPLAGGIITSRFKARYYTFATRLERLAPEVCAQSGEGFETMLDGQRVVVEFYGSKT